MSQIHKYIYSSNRSKEMHVSPTQTSKSCTMQRDRRIVMQHTIIQSGCKHIYIYIYKHEQIYTSTDDNKNQYIVHMQYINTKKIIIPNSYVP